MTSAWYIGILTYDWTGASVVSAPTAASAFSTGVGASFAGMTAEPLASVATASGSTTGASVTGGGSSLASAGYFTSATGASSITFGTM